MKIYGGRAGYNSVRFTGDKYQALSRLKDRKITTETRLKKGDKKITIIFSKVPFVRSFSMVFELIIENWRRFLFAAIVSLLIELIFIGKSNFHLLYTIPINTLEMLFFFLVIAGLVIKISPIGKYHAAEHMIANAYESNQNLTLERVKKQPRTHRDCGTNLAVSIFICFFILSMVFGDGVWVFLVSWSIGYELWKTEPKVIWSSVLMIGKVVQYILFTAKPEDKHLKVAIEAMTRLQEKELANEN